MSPGQKAERLNEISAQVDRAGDLVEAANIAVLTLSTPTEREALGELLHAIAARLDHIAGALHDMPEVTA